MAYHELGTKVRLLETINVAVGIHRTETLRAGTTGTIVRLWPGENGYDVQVDGDNTGDTWFLHDYEVEVIHE